MLDFLNLKPSAFGLDISDFSLKIVKLEKKGKFFGLASFGEKEITPGIIEKGEIKDEKSLTKIIKEALGEVKGKSLDTQYVIASLPEEKAFLQVIQMPIMREEELKKAVRFEAENYVPLSIDKVCLDSQIVPAALDHLDHLDVLITALPKKTVDPYVGCLKKAGLKPLALEMESQAIYRALIDGGMTLKPVLLIDLGASRTGFSIFSGYSLRFTSSVPVSSRKFTQAIANDLKIDFQKAEELKINEGIGGNKEGRKNHKALEPLLMELVGEIEKHIEYYQTHSTHDHLPSGDKKIEKIILCGGGANLKGLSDFLSIELKLPVERGNPWTNILPDPLREVPQLPYEESLRYTTALGLAQRGLNHD